MPHAVWLPSVRAGILWAIQIVAGPETRLIGPAFTCEHVHEAMASSGSPWELVDAAPNGFLMDGESLRSAWHGTTCTIFSEVFGHAYDLSGKLAEGQRTFRIVDMAVTVPNRALLSRLADHDLAMLSFGAGKCMTAGWGGIALARDPDLAGELKSLRDSSLARGTRHLRFTRSARILLQTALYSRILYGHARRLNDGRASGRSGGVPRQLALGPGRPSGGYWRLPSTPIDRNLIQRNLMRAEQYETKRLADARRYRTNLAGVASITLPPYAENALSHFTVRVVGEHRAQIRRCLWKAGIDVGTYFAFPPFMSKANYPTAHRLASEVLNLPMGEGLDGNDIDRICEVLARSAGERRN